MSLRCWFQKVIYMRRRFHVLQGVLTGLVIAFVWLMTFGVASFYQTSIPVGSGLELWRISATDGWSLVIPMGGVVQEELVTRVAGIKRSDGGFIVQRDEGSVLEVSQSDSTWIIRDLQRHSPNEGSPDFRKPGELKSRFVLKRIWWMLAMEAVVAAALSAVVGFALRRTR